MKCDHEFLVEARVARLTAGEGGPLTGYTLHVEARCSRCDEPFLFRGPLGMSPQQPTVSVDQRTLHAPIAPESDPGFGEDGLGMSVQIVTQMDRGPGSRN